MTPGTFLALQFAVPGIRVKLDEIPNESYQIFPIESLWLPSKYLGFKWISNGFLMGPANDRRVLWYPRADWQKFRDQWPKESPEFPWAFPLWGYEVYTAKAILDRFTANIPMPTRGSAAEAYITKNGWDGKSPIETINAMTSAAGGPNVPPVGLDLGALLSNPLVLAGAGLLVYGLMKKRGR